MSAIELVVSAFAVYYLVNVWQKGSIFSTARMYVESTNSWIGELLLCPLCLSVHVAFWLYILMLIGLMPIIYVPAIAGMGYVIYHIMDELDK